MIDIQFAMIQIFINMIIW